MASGPRRFIVGLWHGARAALQPAAPGVGDRPRITLHIGPHKTATTTIQDTLAQNAALLWPEVQVMKRRDPPINALAELSWNIDTPEQLAAQQEAFLAAATGLARACADQPNALISNEDVMGALPTRKGVRGLYPTGPAKLALIVQAMEAAGTDIRFVFYQRSFPDWISSLQRWKKRGAEDRPGRFRRRFDLQTGWPPFLKDLSAAVGADRLVVIPFDQDRVDGRMGLALLRLAGVPEDKIARIDWAEPKKVTRPDTLNPGKVE